MVPQGAPLQMKTCLLILVVTVTAAFAQSDPSMLVSTDWLARHLEDKSLVILHVGSRQDYDAGHIPGARLLTLADISINSDRGLWLELPPVEALEKAFGKVGVGDDTRIVVYPGTDSVQSATRVWFTLDYLGLGARASLLDGGLAAWKVEARRLTTDAPRVEPRQFVAHARPELVVDADWVRAHLNDGGVQLLDARTPEFYSGASAGNMPRAGHIPGARNVPFSSVLDEHRRLKPAGALRDMMHAGGGKRPGLTISYCHIGQQATVLYFVARYLGMTARLYDGSFQDWSRRAELPVQTAAGTR
jgi:thiosulfate/3-mercaptopyruvate sulfurtransferase